METTKKTSFVNNFKKSLGIHRDLISRTFNIDPLHCQYTTMPRCVPQVKRIEKSLIITTNGEIKKSKKKFIQKTITEKIN